VIHKQVNCKLSAIHDIKIRWLRWIDL